MVAYYLHSAAGVLFDPLDDRLVHQLLGFSVEAVVGQVGHQVLLGDVQDLLLAGHLSTGRAVSRKRIQNGTQTRPREFLLESCILSLCPEPDYSVVPRQTTQRSSTDVEKTPHLALCSQLPAKKVAGPRRHKSVAPNRVFIRATAAISGKVIYYYYYCFLLDLEQIIARSTLGFPQRQSKKKQLNEFL